MPDMLTTIEGEAAMAANWNRGHPWHKLGKRVTEDMTIQQAVELSRSNDHVYPATLYTLADGAIFTLPSTGQQAVLVTALEEVEGSIGVKSDVYGTIATAGPGYEITQRQEILEFAYEIEGLSKDEAHIDTIGNIGERGNKFFAYIRAQDIVIDEKGIGDVIEHGIVVATSFDGTIPNLIGPSDIRVVCNNTLEAAIKGKSEKWIKVRHTRNSEERMQEAAVALKYVGAVEKQIIKKAEAMLRVDGTKAMNLVLDEMWDVTSEGIPDKTLTRRRNERGMLMTAYDGPSNLAKDLVGDNGYGVYQAFTDFTDHRRPTRGDLMGTRRAEAAVLPGKVMSDKAKVSELILSLN